MQTKSEKMQDLLSKINLLANKEKMVRKVASSYGLAAAKLRALEWDRLEQAKELENERYTLALAYNKIKNPCPAVLIAAEKALGRQLTVDEILEIEIAYAKKINGCSSNAQ